MRVGQLCVRDRELAAQRERLVDLVAGLARRTSVKAVVVFDGSEGGPPAIRRSRGPVKIEYSLPSETADDHLVALLDHLPAEPVVVVTSDRELQHRVAAKGATVATSPQLLGLIR